MVDLADWRVKVDLLEALDHRVIPLEFSSLV
jgi:hypothetical protein